MTPSENCVNLVKRSEGCELEAYPDPGTGAAPWTIGYGRTTDVHPGDTCTQAEADSWLLDELRGFGEDVEKLVKVPLTQNQFDALVCFAYNVGLGNLKSSTLLKLLNAGDYSGACAQFGRWNKAAGKVLPGLTTRRKAEAELFCGVA